MPYDNIRFETDADGIVLLTIHRPAKLNALNNATMEELDDAFGRIEREREHRGLILTGAGEKAFVAGADIHELSVATPLDGKTRSAMS